MWSLQEPNRNSLIFLVSVLFMTQVNLGLARNCTKLDSCSCRFNDGSGIVDLSRVAKHGTPLILDTVVGRYHYSFNPCFPFNEGTAANCQNVAGCQIDKVRKIWYEIADPNNVTFVYDGTNVVATYQSSNERSSKVTYVCEPSTDPPIIVVQGELCLTVYVSIKLTNDVEIDVDKVSSTSSTC